MDSRRGRVTAESRENLTWTQRNRREHIVRLHRLVDRAGEDSSWGRLLCEAELRFESDFEETA